MLDKYDNGIDHKYRFERWFITVGPFLVENIFNKFSKWLRSVVYIVLQIPPELKHEFEGVCPYGKPHRFYDEKVCLYWKPHGFLVLIGFVRGRLKINEICTEWKILEIFCTEPFLIFPEFFIQYISR